MQSNTFCFSKRKTLWNVLIYFFLFLIGDLLSSLPFDLLFSLVQLPVPTLYIIIRTSTSLVFTVFLFHVYTFKVLHLQPQDFNITLQIKPWGIWIAILLPGSVLTVFALIGQLEIPTHSFAQTVWILLSSATIALKSGITEEILFRGYIMKLLENRWNTRIAVLLPSILFSLAHIPSMKDFSLIGAVLLIISGTLVGILFSLLTYCGDSIANSILVHVSWNFLLITDVLHITTAQQAYGDPLLSIQLPSDHVLLTGSDFGIEASLVAIAGYLLVCIFLLHRSQK